MKALIGLAVAVALLLGTGVMAAVVVSVPAVTDQHLSDYDAVVRERDLEVPWQALMAVDTVRFQQDFSQVDRASIERTADLFALCLPFPAFRIGILPNPPRFPGYSFTAYRPGKLNILVDDPDVAVAVQDSDGRTYSSGEVLPVGEYALVFNATPPDRHFVVIITMDLKPCGPEEVEKIMTDLGLEGDDQQMALHIMAMHIPPEEFYPILNPNGPYVWPLAGEWPITDRFGYRLDPVTGGWRFHTGVDIGADSGTAVHAAAGGFVLHAGYDGNYGNVVRIQHADGQITAYAHLDHYLVAAGQQVGRGEAIGLVGNTGKSTGPHLHFEWWIDGAPVDPLPIYQGETP